MRAEPHGIGTLRYISTRGQAPALDFEDVLLAGLASDGGLYVPESWPPLTAAALAGFAGRPYPEVAAAVLAPFVGAAIPRPELERLLIEAYAGFAHQAVAPLRQLGPNLWLMELFHGPTLAFKDIALQLLGRLFDRALGRRQRRATVLGATSGDTGSAAIEACRGRAALDIFILHPKGRVSEVQRRQMTTVTDANVHNIAIEGTFDDCQALVKAAFGDAAFRESLQLTAVNSINWARVMAQVVYYVAAAAALGAPSRRIAFAVPTGNFGDVYAGYVAARMGVPIARLVVATNVNDILARFFASGDYRCAEVAPTMSPSMDIQVASNFERLLFDLCHRDGGRIARLMHQLQRERGFRVEAGELEAARRHFAAERVDEIETLAAIADTHRHAGITVDPHTAVGIAAARRRTDPDVPMVALATAHPAKFPEAVERATGARPALPPRLADLLDRPERCATLPNDLGRLEAFMRERVAHGPAERVRA